MGNLIDCKQVRDPLQAKNSDIFQIWQMVKGQQVIRSVMKNKKQIAYRELDLNPVFAAVQAKGIEDVFSAVELLQRVFFEVTAALDGGQA